MKTLLRALPITLSVLFIALYMTSCEAIAGIFKAGAWTGALMVIVGLGLVIWLVAKLFGGGGGRSV